MRRFHLNLSPFSPSMAPWIAAMDGTTWLLLESTFPSPRTRTAPDASTLEACLGRCQVVAYWCIWRHCLVPGCVAGVMHHVRHFWMPLAPVLQELGCIPLGRHVHPDMGFTCGIWTACPHLPSWPDDMPRVLYAGPDDSIEHGLKSEPVRKLFWEARIFWFSLKTSGDVLPVVWPQNHYNSFLVWVSKPRSTVWWFGPQNTATVLGLGLNTKSEEVCRFAPQNRWVDEDGMRTCINIWWLTSSWSMSG
jgi:hypothetical protein